MTLLLCFVVVLANFLLVVDLDLNRLYDMLNSRSADNSMLHSHFAAA